jgi:hypothetical protein
MESTTTVAPTEGAFPQNLEQGTPKTPELPFWEVLGVLGVATLGGSEKSRATNE